MRFAWRHIAPHKIMLAFLFKVWGLAKPYHARLFLGVLTGILSGLMAPLMISTIMFVYGAVFPTRDGEGNIQLPFSRTPGFVDEWFHNARTVLENGLQTHSLALWSVIAAIPAITFLRGFFGYLNIYFLQWTANRTIADLRSRLFSHLLNLSAGFHSENSTGLLISRVANDTSALQSIFSNTTSVIIRDPITLASVLGLLLWQQPKLTVIAFIAMPVCIIPVIIFSRKVRKSTRDMQNRFAEQMQIMTESFSGHRIIKAYNLEERVAQQFKAAARKSVSQQMRIIRAMEIPGPLIEFFGSCGVAILLVYLIKFSYANHPKPTDFLQLIGSIFLMYQPIKNLTRLQNQFVQARAAGERVFALLDTPNTVPEPAHPKPIQATGAEIQFEHVSFAYGEKTVLHDINLTVKPGQLVALVGSSGSGKTTLSNLLLRFYDPAQGSIRIGGTDIREFSTQDLRNQIAVVTQETILFNETIRRNIELGRPGATDEEILAAARHAFAEQFIAEKPDGFETIIGERGVSLSGGQRQRLTIARAVVRNAPILILDEATNALDTQSERVVQKALDELMKGRTTLCIAHRLSTILHADLIVVMDQGRILESGKHEELLNRGGVYQKLYELQFEN